MNTFFKFSAGAWLLLAISVAIESTKDGAWLGLRAVAMLIGGMAAMMWPTPPEK